MLTSTEDHVAVLNELLTQRRSCRAFRDEPVPREVLDRLLTMSQRSPSWCNTQPWHLTVVCGPALEKLRSEFVDHAREHAPESDFEFPTAYTGDLLARRRECAWQLYESVGVARGDRRASAEQALQNFQFFGAPAVAVITTEADVGVYGAVDCGVYVGNFLLAAESLGLATIAQAALAAHAPFLRERLSIPDHRKIVLGISFGYADREHPANAFRTTRAGVASAATVIS